MELLQLFIFILIGSLTGFFTGLFGIGGGSIRVPLLIFSGMPMVTAFATNMFAIPFTSATGAFIQRRNINKKVVLYFTTGGVGGIIIATFLANTVATQVLAITFFVAAVITIFGLYLDKINHHIYDKIKPTKVNLFCAAFVGNLIIGLRGGSGGTLFPPILRSMHVHMHQAIATALFAGFFSSIVATMIYFLNGEVLIIPGLIIACTGIIGSYFGSTISMKTESKMLKLFLSVVVFILAVMVLYNEFA